MTTDADMKAAKKLCPGMDECMFAEDYANGDSCMNGKAECQVETIIAKHMQPERDAVAGLVEALGATWECSGCGGHNCATCAVEDKRKAAWEKYNKEKK